MVNASRACALHKQHDTSSESVDSVYPGVLDSPVHTGLSLPVMLGNLERGGEWSMPGQGTQDETL